MVDVAALNIAFTPTELSVAPDVAFQINFANNDAGIPHNVAIKDAAGATIFNGDIFNGVETRTYDVQPLAAGTYQFVCSVHTNMTGTLTASDLDGSMTPAGEQLCYTDAYARSATTRVRHVEAGEATLVVLDRTVFYPGGGGQPSDRGVLLRAADGRTWTVRGARKAGGEIVHELEPADGDPPSVGDELQVDLDWARRFALMRTHTALHALCGVVWRDHGALVTGGNMEPGSGRMDFEFERMSGDLVDMIEARVNAELAAAREVRVNVLPRAEAFADPRPDPHEDQPAARGYRGDPDDRDRRPRPAGRRRHPCRQHERGRRDPGDRLRVQGPDQQAHPDRAGRAGAAARVGCGPRRNSGSVADQWQPGPTFCSNCSS